MKHQLIFFVLLSILFIVCACSVSPAVMTPTVHGSSVMTVPTEESPVVVAGLAVSGEADQSNQSEAKSLRVFVCEDQFEPGQILGARFCRQTKKVKLDHQPPFSEADFFVEGEWSYISLQFEGDSEIHILRPKRNSLDTSGRPTLLFVKDERVTATPLCH